MPPQYPLEADKLFEVADLLAPPRASRGRPSYTAHRRAVSTAYYALFHQITARVVESTFSTANDEFKRTIRRWIAHGDISVVCQWVSTLHGAGNYSVPADIRQLLVPGGSSLVDAATISIADGFLDLIEKRHEADYDHGAGAVFTRTDTRGLIQLARQTANLVEAQASMSLDIFFGLIAVHAQKRRR